MGNISRANVYDVLKNQPRDRTAVVKGEQRIIKRPEARVAEEFVDPTGNVVWLQLLKLGTTEGLEAVDKERGRRNRQGFVEYSKCPLKHGVAFKTEQLAEEFAELPEHLLRPCKEDPEIWTRKGRKNLANDACPHIQWLVASRVVAETERRDLRATKIESAQDIEKQKLSIAEQQLEETRKVNERLIAAVEQLGGKRSKGKDKDGE